MNILIYAENGVGLGHIVRTINLANSLVRFNKKINILFITTSKFTKIFKLNGYQVVNLPSSSLRAGGDDRFNKLFSSILLKFKPDVFIVDGHFSIDAIIKSGLSDTFKKVLILRKIVNSNLYKIKSDPYYNFFDLVLFPHTKKEFLDYGVKNEYITSLDEKKFIFLGPIIRSFFNGGRLNSLKEKYSINGNKFNILFSLGGGGTDKNHKSTIQLFRLIRKTINRFKGNKKFNLILITGPFFTFKFKPFSDNIKIIPFEPFFFELLHLIDLVISPASYNLCNEITLTHTPSILIPLKRQNESQYERAKLLEKEGISYTLDKFDDKTLFNLILSTLNKEKTNSKLGGKKVKGNTNIKKIYDLFNMHNYNKNKSLGLRVGILRVDWLPLTERFIFDELISFSFCRPYVFCVHKQDNFEQKFGLFHKKIFKNLFSEEFPLIQKKYLKLYNHMIKQYCKIIRNKNINILHAQFMADALFFLKLKRLTKLPLIVSVRGYDLYSLKHIDYKPLFEEADLFLVRSNIMKKDLIERGYNFNKIKVHHSGIRLSYDKLMDKSYSGKINILMVGRFVEKKGTIFGIRLFNMLRKKYKHIRLNIIGGGPLKNLILKEVKSSPFTKEIILFGELHNNEVLEIMDKSHILLQPSETAKDGNKEGIPNSIMEAMSLGLVVVASDNGSISEIVKDEKTGFIFKEGSYEGARNKLSYVVENKCNFKEIRINAFKKVKRDFNIEKQTKKLESIYTSVINKYESANN